MSPRLHSAVHAVAIAGLAGWVALASAGQLAGWGRFAAAIAAAMAIAVATAREPRAWVRRAVLLATFAVYLAWIASAATGPVIQRPVVQTVVEAGLVAALLERRALTWLPPAFVAVVVAIGYEATRLYDAAATPRTFWLIQLAVVVAAAFVRWLRS